MGSLIAVALKGGLAALPAIAAEWGLLGALFALIVLLPLGHLLVGVALVLCGAAIPKLPGDQTTHSIDIGLGDYKVVVNGDARTMLFGAGLLIILGSIIEWIAAAISHT